MSPQCIFRLIFCEVVKSKNIAYPCWRHHMSPLNDEVRISFKLSSITQYNFYYKDFIL